MDIMERLQDSLIVLMEDVLEDFEDPKFHLELTITNTHVPLYTQNITRYFKLDSFSREELSSILQNLRASNAGTSSSTQE